MDAIVSLETTIASHIAIDNTAIVSIHFPYAGLYLCAGLTSWVSAPTLQRTNLESRRQQKTVSLMCLNIEQGPRVWVDNSREALIRCH